MRPFIAKINDLNMIEIPKALCKRYELTEKSEIYITIEYGKVILRGSFYGGRAVIMKQIDEFNRMVLPQPIRDYLYIKPNDTVLLKPRKDGIVLANF